MDQERPLPVCSIKNQFRHNEFEQVLFYTYNNEALQELENATVFSVRTKKETINLNARKNTESYI